MSRRTYGAVLAATFATACGIYDSGGPLGQKELGPAPDYSDEAVLEFPADDDGCATFRASIVSDGDGKFAAVGVIQNDCEIDAAFDFIEKAGAPRDDEEYDTTDVREKHLEFEGPAVQVSRDSRRDDGHFMSCDLSSERLEFTHVRRVHLRPGEWVEMRNDLPGHVEPRCIDGSCARYVDDRVFFFAYWPIPHRSTDPIDRRAGYDPEAACEARVRGGDPADASGVGKATAAVVSTADSPLGELVESIGE